MGRDEKTTIKKSSVCGGLFVCVRACGKKKKKKMSADGHENKRQTELVNVTAEC